MVDPSDIIMRLELITEELTDMSMAILTQAIDTGESSRPLEDKSVLQARRAIEKAIMHLAKIASND
jgi:hypothetical protein